MSKLANGPASWHVLASNGPQAHPLQFYSTTYSVTHGRKGSQPFKNFRHKGTGYDANFRPAIYYSPKLDDIDNPTMGRLLKDNYDTHSQKEFISYKVPSGRYPIPGDVKPYRSGFAHNNPKTVPPSKQVRGVHVDTANESTSVPVYPRHRALLHSCEPQDPIANENAGHGPKAMSTECHTRFQKKMFRDEDLYSSKHSCKEHTGFTRDCNVEPVTFRPHENHSGELPGHVTWRPTGKSVMSNSFREPVYMIGKEPFQSVSGAGDRSNGYVKGSKAIADVQPQVSDMVGCAHQVHPSVLQRVKKADPAEFSVLVQPGQYTSFTQSSFRGGQEWPPSEAKRLGREAVGNKELSGFAENNCPLIEPRDRDVSRFSTRYRDKFSNPNPVGSARQGHLTVHRGVGVQPFLPNGFSKSTQVHRFGAPLDTAKTLRKLDPYVARSVMRSDPCFDDHTYDAKKHSITTL